MILNAPVTGSTFDGAWATSWSCQEYAGAPSFIYQFVGQVKDGVYHGTGRQRPAQLADG